VDRENSNLIISLVDWQFISTRMVSCIKALTRIILGFNDRLDSEGGMDRVVRLVSHNFIR
jgi:hypothetical protein